jgi:hypothetical protein
MAQGEVMQGSCDRSDIGWPTEKSKFLVRRIFSQSASTMQSGDTSLTLNFWQHVIKERQESVILGTLRNYQGSEQDVRVCVCVCTLVEH